MGVAEERLCQRCPSQLVQERPVVNNQQCNNDQIVPRRCSLSLEALIALSRSPGARRSSTERIMRGPDFINADHISVVTDTITWRRSKLPSRLSTED